MRIFYAEYCDGNGHYVLHVHYDSSELDEMKSIFEYCTCNTNFLPTLSVQYTSAIDN